jgi:hypothetical protein
MGNYHVFKKSGFWLFFLLILTSCQKDDVKQESFHHFSDENLNHKMVTADDIPEVMQFLWANAAPDLKFLIQTEGIPGVLNKSGELDLIISELNTEQVLAVTNESDLTNYSFQLIVDTAPHYEGEVSFFNLIVKETTAVEGYYAYIKEYRMDENWYVGNESILDMYTYTGKMIFYTIEGVYVAKLDFLDGRIIGEDLRSPCPPDTGGGSSGGGGSGSGPGDGGTGGSGGGTGGGTGGGGIQIIVVGCTCYTPPHQPGEACDCNNPPYIVIVWGSEIDDINETLRSPCDELPPQCSHPNGDPCPCNAINEGCIEENPSVGVLIIKPHPDCTKLNQILAHQPTKSKIENLQNDLNSPIEKGFNLYMNSNGDVLSTPIAPGQIDSFNLSTSSAVFGGVHLHHNGIYPMFSLGDPLALYNLWTNFDNGTNDSYLITNIMVSQYGVYAIKIKNVGQLTNFYNLATGNQGIKEFLNDKLRDNYESLSDPITGQLTGNSIAFEKAFLEFMGDYDSGVSLYKAKNDLSGWDRKDLNQSGTPVSTYSCD